jgi:hypothetical protein
MAGDWIPTAALGWGDLAEKQGSHLQRNSPHLQRKMSRKDGPVGSRVSADNDLRT